MSKNASGRHTRVPPLVWTSDSARATSMETAMSPEDVKVQVSTYCAMAAVSLPAMIEKYVAFRRAIEAGEFTDVDVFKDTTARLVADEGVIAVAIARCVDVLDVEVPDAEDPGLLALRTLYPVIRTLGDSFVLMAGLPSASYASEVMILDPALAATFTAEEPWRGALERCEEVGASRLSGAPGR